MTKLNSVLRLPYVWSFAGAALIFLAAIVAANGQGVSGMANAATSLAVFTVIVGIGQMFVITLGPGNVDLSLPANIGLASAVAMKVMNGQDGMILVGILAAIGAGVLVGLANHVLIALLRIPPIIATLSASFIIQSIDISYGRGLQIKPPPAFAAFTSVDVAGVKLFVVLAVALSAFFALVLHRFVFGRFVMAIGQNLRAAWLAGIPVNRISAMTYMLCGGLGGLAGALLAAYFHGASIDIGSDYLLTSIAAVVIGGTSIGGGQATVAGLWGGALFLVFLQILMNSMGADAGMRLMATGLVILAVITAAGGPRALR